MFFLTIDRSMSLATSRGFQVSNWFWPTWPWTQEGREKEERCNESEAVLLCECFIAQQEIKKAFGISHKAVVMLDKYNENTGDGVKWKSRFPKSVGENDSTETDD